MPSDENSKMARLFRSLSSEVRMEIIRLLLASEKPIHIKGIARSLKLDYAAAYRHIEDLREMGLVDIYEVGRSRVPYVKRKAEVAMLLDAANKLL